MNKTRPVQLAVATTLAVTISGIATWLFLGIIEDSVATQVMFKTLLIEGLILLVAFVIRYMSQNKEG
jgi:ABC-type bacteriocin/lantibiotic exporter with double-glycine peptidase domain